jgi:hypothetical protein
MLGAAELVIGIDYVFRDHAHSQIVQQAADPYFTDLFFVKFQGGRDIDGENGSVD